MLPGGRGPGGVVSQGAPSQPSRREKSCCPPLAPPVPPLAHDYAGHRTLAGHATARSNRVRPGQRRAHLVAGLDSIIECVLDDWQPEEQTVGQPAAHPRELPLPARLPAKAGSCSARSCCQLVQHSSGAVPMPDIQAPSPAGKKESTPNTPSPAARPPFPLPQESGTEVGLPAPTLLRGPIRE